MQRSLRITPYVQHTRTTLQRCISHPAETSIRRRAYASQANASEDNIPSIWEMYDMQKVRQRGRPLSGLNRVMVNKRHKQKPLSLESVTPTLDVSVNELFSLSRTIAPELAAEKSPIGMAVQLNLPRSIQVNSLKGSVTFPHAISADEEDKVVAVLAEESRKDEIEKLGDKVKYFVDEKQLRQFIVEIQEDQVKLDHLIATPALFKALVSIPRVGVILGPRGLMPSEKRGSVTNDIPMAVAQAAGSTDWAANRDECVQLDIGHLAMTPAQLKQNILTLLVALNERMSISKLDTIASPSFNKNPYVKSVEFTTVPGLPFRLHLDENMS